MDGFVVKTAGNQFRLAISLSQNS